MTFDLNFFSGISPSSNSELAYFRLNSLLRTKKVDKTFFKNLSEGIKEPLRQKGLEEWRL